MAKITMDGHEITKLVLKPASGASVTKNLVATNSFGSSDEGKVVSNGALKAQTSLNIDKNGTYDTTDKNSVVVGVAGSGGGTVIASGTFTGDDSVTSTVPIGKKMAKTNFVFLLCAREGQVFDNSSDRKRTYVMDTVVSPDCFNFDEDGTKTIYSPRTLKVTDGTTETSVAYARFTARLCGTIRGSSTLQNVILANLANMRWKRDTDGFSIMMSGYTVGNEGTLVQDVPYDRKLIYFGTDPENEIIEIE